MKKILLSFLIALVWIFLLFKISYWEEKSECKYKEKIDKCSQANVDWNTRWVSESEKMICIEWSREEIALQLALDEKFSKIDDKIDLYLTNLEKDKDRFFWPNADSNYIEASNELEKNFSVFWKYWHEYNDFCWVELIEEVMACQNQEASTINSSKYFKNSTCMNLAVTKLQIYRRVAYNILELNKKSVREDSSKEHMQLERTKYNEVFQLIRTNVWYLDSISKKWPSKLRNPYGW